MSDEKDRFGDKLREAERAREDQYFANRDRELIDKLKRGKDEEVDAALAEAARDRCPRDGSGLRPRKLRGVAVEECPTCQGMWLEAGEWKLLAEREKGGFFARWFLGDRDA